jgi:hypothetical protein
VEMGELGTRGTGPDGRMVTQEADGSAGVHSGGREAMLTKLHTQNSFPFRCKLFSSVEKRQSLQQPLECLPGPSVCFFTAEAVAPFSRYDASNGRQLRTPFSSHRSFLSFVIFSTSVENRFSELPPVLRTARAFCTFFGLERNGRVRNFLMTRIFVYYFLLLPSGACFSRNGESVVCCDGKYCSCFVI